MVEQSCRKLNLGEQVWESAGLADTGVYLPLTPALSRGEREFHRPRLSELEVRWLVEKWATILPLPLGEGRGEGNQAARLPHPQARLRHPPIVV